MVALFLLPLMLGSLVIPALLPSPAGAGERIYVFVDERGVPTFSNYQPDARFKPYKPDRVTSGRPERTMGLSRSAERLDGSINRLASAYGVDPDLVRAMIQVESDFDIAAVSPKGARGLMQLMPDTATLYSVRDPFDPRENLQAGIRHMRRLMDSFGGDLKLALAAYNAGEGKVLLHKGVPPYPETKRYVRKVMNLYSGMKGPALRR